MESATATTMNVKMVIDAAVEAGVSERFLYDAVGLAPEILETHGRIDKSLLKALWHAASQLSGDPFFGLHAGERLKASHFGLIGFVIRSCATVGEAVERGVLYTNSFFDDTEAHLVIEGPVAEIRYRYAPVELTSPHACDYMMAALLTAGRTLSGIDWEPLQVALQREKPEILDEHERLFRAPLHFGADWNVLAFDRSLLDIQLGDSDPELLALLGRYVDEFLAEAARVPRMASRVREILARTLRDGEPSTELVAKKLGVSSRTLKRQLRDEGSSFRELLESVRSALARRYLLERSLSEEDVSTLLGFEDPAAFRGAFERWSGLSPGEFRERDEDARG